MIERDGYDGYACYLCKRPVLRDVSPNHDLALAIDHFVPHSAGGTDAIANLRVSHRICNTEKGDKIPGIDFWWSATA